MTPELPLYETQLITLISICSVFGHLAEGRLHGGYCVGRCQRCGIGLLTDGS